MTSDTPTVSYQPSTHSMVREFHEAFGIPRSPIAPRIDDDTKNIIWNLIMEEWKEVRNELFPQNSPQNIAKELADLVYVCYGAAVRMGVDLDVVIREVHKSNMTKLGEDGKPIYREDGKVLKGPDYKEANMDGIVSDAL